MKNLIPIFLAITIFIHSLLSWKKLILLSKIRELGTILNKLNNGTKSILSQFNQRVV